MKAAVVEQCLDFFQGLVMAKYQFSFKLSLDKDIFEFNSKELVKSSFLIKKKKVPRQARREEKDRKRSKDHQIGHCENDRSEETNHVQVCQM